MTVGVVQRASHSQAMRMYVLGRGGYRGGRASCPFCGGGGGMRCHRP